MKLALDTNRYGDLFRGVPEVIAGIRSAQAIVLPFAVLGELRAGFAAGSRQAQNEADLARFLRNPRVRVAHTDAETTRIYAQLWHQLRTQGTPIPTNDIWIAAITLQHGLTLYSRDPHFAHLPQVPRL